MSKDVAGSGKEPEVILKRDATLLELANEELNDAVYGLQQAELTLRNARSNEKRARAMVAQARRNGGA